MSYLFLLEEAEGEFLSDRVGEAYNLACLARACLARESDLPLPPSVEKFVAAYGVHLAATKNKNAKGELDWYGVLGVDASSPTQLIRKSYENLIGLLHPIHWKRQSDRSEAADGALEIVCSAWKALGDPRNRLAYNVRCGLAAGGGGGGHKRCALEMQTHKKTKRCRLV